MVNPMEVETVEVRIKVSRKMKNFPASAWKPTGGEGGYVCVCVFVCVCVCVCVFWPALFFRI